eukprot:CAMPEP_0171400000 /NCGR_PEP_ID=MMETSP0880-20121228/6987_1 /TAXON_ID=67004 /ORGANISM="Thalassiosira weissflogii, Strain CCMP1336" /LENGTH=362 /DNA_ID=CAMNT_0011914253 /DNA_START=19 /DNA_END=1107 /DNA_ORIENTATION=-
MGQAASRVTGNLTKVATKAGKNAVAPDGIFRSAAGAKAKDAYSPTRGAGHDMVSQNNETGAEAGPPEMPPDLIKFLNDAGPLKRSIDRELTSPKVYDMLVKENNDSQKNFDNARSKRTGEPMFVNKGDEVNTAIRDQQAKEANVRVRRKMPIVGGNDGELIKSFKSENGSGSDVDDGTMVTRTTNFSTTDRSELYTGFRLKREDLFLLASSTEDVLSVLNAPSNGNEDSSSNEFANEKSAKDPARDINLEELKQKIRNIISQGDAEDRLQTTQPQISQKKKALSTSELLEIMTVEDAWLLQNTLQYVSIPALMKDNDGDILGTYSDKASELNFSAGLKVVKDGAVKFALVEESGIGHKMSQK